jgi:hypothetical protein
MSRRWALLLALLLGGGCASIPSADLRTAQFAIEVRDSVYLLDGTGGAPALTLARRQTRDRSGRVSALYDHYVDPSLSPDRASIACVRRRNHDPYRSRMRDPSPEDVIEVLIVRVADRAEQIVMSVPATSPAARGMIGPVWSTDGRRVFFGADRRIWAYRLGAERPDVVMVLPATYLTSLRLTAHYLRVAAPGDRLLGLFPGPGLLDHVIVEIDPVRGALTPLWSGTLSSRLGGDVDRPLTAPVAEDVVLALFGSRERPVLGPRSSPDGRFYFFERYRQGPLGRRWVAGYDRVTRTEFEVRTMWRTLWWE